MRTILAAGGLSLLLTLLVTPQFIKFLTRRQYGQFIRDDGPKEHLTKRGTPTMGGVVIIASVVLSYFLAHLILWESVTISGVLLVGVMTALGFLGFLDDWAKISKERSLGLTPRGKLIGQFTIGGVVAVLAGLSIMTRTELLLVIMGFLFVMEAGSVALQVGYFKATKGKRIFKMSPIHHHFELLGWQEVTVVIRFWIICGLCVAIGVGIFYAEWVVGQ